MEDTIAWIAMLAAAVGIFALITWFLISMLTLPVGQILIGAGLFVAGYFTGKFNQGSST